jgi:hypothetical protein
MDSDIKPGNLVKLQKGRSIYSGVDLKANKWFNIMPDMVLLYIEPGVYLINDKLISAEPSVFELAKE